MAKSLFITYDGLTDPLGQSQILPYLAGLSSNGHQISVLSCEKEERYSKFRTNIEQICRTNKISWTPLRFHRKPPIVSKYYDLYALKATAFKLYNKQHFDIIHCRSYLAAEIGMKLQAKKGVKFLFDMRGFWVDERVDGGLWNMDAPLYRIAYKRWKRKEARFIRKADQIISLTQAGKTEIESWPSYSGTPINVIPCSADLELFTRPKNDEKKDSRKLLNLSPDSFVLSYLGSLGTWYMLEEMLLLFKRIKFQHKNARFLILTPDDAGKVLDKAVLLGLDASDFIIKYAQRKDVPSLLRCSDVSVSFIKPAYSKIASSPTKLGELLAMDIPVVCNDIGDVSSIITATNGGFIMKDFSEESFTAAMDYINRLENGVEIDHFNVESYYSLEHAVNCYHEIYQELNT
jgi:glycosyltransferase involved in cell wall biosynthesis